MKKLFTMMTVGSIVAGLYGYAIPTLSRGWILV